MDKITILDCLIAITIFFWIFISFNNYPYPLNLLLFSNFTLILLIIKTLKSK